jgi:esterase
VPEARVNGVRLYYEEHGHGAPIACIHGGGSSALLWADALEELARLGRVIAYDRRGCTRSERPEPYERTSVVEQADDAAALLDALVAAPAVVIGRSYGGAVAVDPHCATRTGCGRWCCSRETRSVSRPRGWSGRRRSAMDSVR